ncbi:MAG: type II toxin-antitoxin system VapC family toxin [Candidatus Rokuibacteriota bacterium]
MILLDTSVLVPFLRGRATRTTRFLTRVLEEGLDVFLAPIVVQEVLQGARNDQEWQTLDTYLSSQALIHPQDAAAAHRQAARIYFDCRRQGLTVRSTIDCLIAQLALDHDLAILHEDRDYDAIRRVRPLRTLP